MYVSSHFTADSGDECLWVLQANQGLEVGGERETGSLRDCISEEKNDHVHFILKSHLF